MCKCRQANEVCRDGRPSGPFETSEHTSAHSSAEETSAGAGARARNLTSHTRANHPAGSYGFVFNSSRPPPFPRPRRLWRECGERVLACSAWPGRVVASPGRPRDPIPTGSGRLSVPESSQSGSNDRADRTPPNRVQETCFRSYRSYRVVLLFTGAPSPWVFGNILCFNDIHQQETEIFKVSVE